MQNFSEPRTGLQVRFSKNPNFEPDFRSSSKKFGSNFSSEPNNGIPMPDYKIYVTADASDTCSGAVLSFGPSWETSRPVAFYSSTFKDTELNYPVHEKELLAVIRALKKWRSDLVGSPFFVFTDHKTLENFDKQKDLSRRQARWMEFLSQYDSHFVCVKRDC